MLLGIRSLRALKTVIDFEKDVAVFAFLNPYVGISSRRSASGHVLINLSQNWMQDSFQLADPTPAFGIAEQSCEAKEGVIGAVLAVPSECETSQHVGPDNVTAPDEASECPAVLFQSRGSVGLWIR